jgi:hypothetical protein
LPPVQIAQAAPPEPHASGPVPGMQTLPWQQPDGHEAASQIHVPLEHLWPAPHGGPPSHRHAPPTQESAVMPQFTHPPPPVPQAEALGVTHVVPAQHP